MENNGTQESSMFTRKDLSEVLIHFHDNLVKVVDANFSEMGERFGKVEKGLADVRDSLRLFVVKQDLAAYPTKDGVTAQIIFHLKGKRPGGYPAVAEDSQEYNSKE
jgi:hypothetical protein